MPGDWHRRRRRRHGGGGGGAPRPDRASPESSPLLRPIVRARRLDFDRPVSEPLDSDEQREMSEHLAFLRRYKAILRLSLNAAEDLLVQGARPPLDRGVCKHLISKVDRTLVDRALQREPLRDDAAMRARLLAGTVRLNPDPALLLFYLETLASVADRREAAAAFALTVDRVDFAALSNAQIGTLLEVILRTFDGHDRVQALFGLLRSDSFERALERALPGLADDLIAVFAPLRAAHRFVFLGLPARDDAERALVDAGVAALLSAPDAVLRAHPPEVRARLAELAAEQPDLAAGARAALALVDSLAHGEPSYARLACTLADRLIVARREETARGLFGQVLQAHPGSARARQRREALGWPRIGRLALASERAEAEGAGRLRRGFWLDAAAFVWARVAAPRDAGRLAREAELHASLAVPGVLAFLGSGSGEDGRPFVLCAPGGRVLDPRRTERWSLADALSLASEAARILLALSAAGISLPDAAPARFVIERGAARALRLGDLDGAERLEPTAIRDRHAAHARDLARRILLAPAGDASQEPPLGVRAALARPLSLAELVRTLAEQAARAADGA